MTTSTARGLRLKWGDDEARAPQEAREAAPSPRAEESIVYSDYWACAACGAVLYSPTTGRADGVPCWRCSNQPLTIGESHPTHWEPVATAYSRAIAARNTLRGFLRAEPAADAALAELDIAITLMRAEAPEPAARPLAAPVAEKGWQPIETAPEAEYVIVWVPNAGWKRAIRTAELWWDGEEIIVRPSHWQREPATPASGERTER